ncbi:MAG: hypothetical protein ACRC0A_05770 [Chitinophagaceae bacterium]
MKKILFILTLFISLYSVGQKITKDVDNGIFVTFPNTPEYTPTVQNLSYVTLKPIIVPI